jgi:glycosyltransferase involved in cell wall biosynthesis
MCLLEAVKDTKLRIALVGNGKQKEDLLQNASKNKVPLTQIDGMSNGDLPDFLNSCRLFVLPSHFEGCPKALLEAMACGLPVIGNDMIGINDVICHNTNGLLFNGSAVDLKNQIDLLLADTTLQKRLAKAARKYVLQNHSLETILSLETKLYETTA